jgi:hypothetical protein
MIAFPEMLLTCQDRDCGQSFLSDDSERKYCDPCLVERINGAGVFEDDDDELAAPASPVALQWSPSIPVLAKLALTPDLFRAACTQWRLGCPFFGHWAARHVKPWNARAYGDLIALVRRALGDDGLIDKELTHA